MATTRQKMALDNLVENGGNIGKAMRAVGYSKETAKTPQKLTNSKGWNELLEKHLPDSLLTKVHKEGLSATKYESQLTGKGESEMVEVPDFSVRHKYLETGYKVKSKYSESQGNQILIINVAGESASRYETLTRPSGDSV